MKNFYFKQLFAAFLLLCSTVATAHDFGVDGIYYNITDATARTVAVTYRGSYRGSYSNEYSGAVTIPSSVTYSGTTYSVTSIGIYAFEDCSGLTSVTIPNSVTSIGSSAFAYSGLKSITIPNSVTSIGYEAFSGCTGLTSVIIPSSVTSFGDRAFYYCTGLTSVVIGNSVTSIGGSAFQYCTGLTSITIPNSVTSIGSYAFYDCSGLTSVTIGSGVKSIDNSAFYGCKSLAAVHINDLAAWCNIDFDNYSSNPLCNADNLYLNGVKVTDLVIPDGVTKIKQYAFRYCTSLTSITIPNSVTSIGIYAFEDCSGLTSVTIPNSVTSIGEYAFDGCSGLKEVHISDLAAWCKIDFANDESNPLYHAIIYLIGEKVTNLIIPDGVTKIKKYAFYNCSGLTSVTIPNSVTSIGSSAFDGCSGLTSVTIGNSVTSIGECAFEACSGLTSVTIPENVTRIGELAFHCSGLTSITIPNSVTNIGQGAFLGCSGLKEVINLSNLTFVKDSEDYGYVAFYADKVINAPNGSIKGDFVFAVIDDVNTLVTYLGNGGAVTIPSSVTYGGATYSATSIGSSAFEGCSSLTSITIPNSVTSIGSSAFEGCSGFTSVTISENVTHIGSYAFYGCKSLAAVHINDLAAWCNIDFDNYSSNPLCNADNLYLNGVKVTDLVIPDGVTKIKQYAFRYCDGLTSIEIPNSVTSIGNGAFENCDGLTSVTIGNRVTSIGSYAFNYCTGLKSITIPNSVTSIGSSAFKGCTGLTSVTISSSVTSIGYEMFEGCSGLTSITIPNSVTSIGSDAFYNCNGLTSIVIPNSVTSIGGSAFNSCSGLTSITVNSGNSIYDSREGCNAIIETATNTLIAGCKNTIIPNSVTSIGSSAFWGCDGLTSVTIGNSVTSIGRYAFYYCDGLTSITIPNSVTSIGSSAFEGCRGLTEIYSLAETPATITYNTFNKYSVTLYVPAGAKEAYQAANYWKNFTNIVEMESAETLPGDINGDNKVDVGDVTILIGMILDASLLTDSGDINGDNKVDVGDVTTLVAIILGTNNTPARAAAMEEYNVELSVEGDEQSLTIDATATDYPYSAVQFDVYLPAGVKAIGNMVVGCGNAAAYKEQADGAVRVVIYSPSNTAIANKSASIAIDATRLALGSHPVEVKNIILAAPGRAKAIAWDSTGYITIAGTTGIDGVVSDAGNADAVVYDLQGHRVTEIVKGRVYIKNGSKFIAQ